MRIRSRLATLFSTLFILVALVAVTGVSFGGSATPSDALPSATLESTAVDAAPADECAAPADSVDAVDDASAYECPNGVPYCWVDSQCEDFCGGGGFEVCYRGCCTCAG